MELSIHIGWDLPGAWKKHGRIRKAWFAHAWGGIDYAFLRRFTTGFRLLGFSMSIVFDF